MPDCEAAASVNALGGRGAALHGDLSMVKALCEAGANPLAESQVGRHLQVCLTLAGRVQEALCAHAVTYNSKRRSRHLRNGRSGAHAQRA